MKKVTLTWWMGWIITAPVRVLYLLIVLIFCAFMPKLFYGIINAKIEEDQEKWKY